MPVEQAWLPWTRVVRPRAGGSGGQPDVSLFAVHLGAVVHQPMDCPALYRDASLFFAATYPSKHLRALVQECMARLCGEPGERVLQLQTPFGGGKTHALVALYHWASHYAQSADATGWEEVSAPPDETRVVVLSGVDFDPHEGMTFPDGPTCHTLWGALAWMVGGAAAFERFAEHDRSRTAPGGALLHELLREAPVLLLLDELLLYLGKTKAVTLGDSTLGQQNLLFLQTLTEVVRSLRQGVMVYTLQSSVEEALQDEALLRTLAQLSGRLDARRTPLEGHELIHVLRRRLFEDLGSVQQRKAVAAAYSQSLSAHLRLLGTNDPSHTEQAAREAGASLYQAILQAYPFHPALLELLSSHWSRLPSYQRTRGALQLLAQVIAAYEDPETPPTPAHGLLGPGDLLLHHDAVQRIFCAQIGESPSQIPALQTDLLSPTGAAAKVSQFLQGEPTFASFASLGQRMACALLAFSFGGASEEERGLQAESLLRSVLTPQLEPLLWRKAWEQLQQHAHYLHKHKELHRFLPRPNLNRWLEEGSQRWEQEEVQRRLHKLLRQEHIPQAPLWPQKNSELHDRIPALQVVYLDRSFGQLDPPQQQKRIRRWLEYRGRRTRLYRNALVFAEPSEVIWQQSTQKLRRLMTVESLLLESQATLEPQEEVQLESLQRTLQGELSRLCARLYETIHVPVGERNQGRSYHFERIELSTLALQEQSLQERIHEALFLRFLLSPHLEPDKLLELFRGPQQGPAPARIGLSQVQDSFFSYFAFPRLLDRKPLEEAVAQGVKQKHFGLFVATAPIAPEQVLSADEPQGNLYFGQEPPLERLQWESPRIFLLSATESESLSASQPPPSETHPTPPPIPAPETPGSPSTQRIHIEAQAQQLDLLWSVLQPLRDKTSGLKASVTLEWQSEDGPDKRWLTLRFEDPLLEAGILVSKEPKD